MSEVPAPHESVREAALDDLQVLVDLAEAAVVEKLEQRGGPVWSRAESRQHGADARLRSRLAAPDSRIVLGLIDGTPVGYGLAYIRTLDDGGRLGVVEDLYVDPGCRAVGIGEVVMKDLLEWCEAEGCFGVDSLALPGDRSTKNFFESFGLVARAIVVHRSLSSPRNRSNAL